MKFIVKRSKWLRGEGTRSKLLRKSDGKMCCLGFLAKACGYTDEEIIEKRTLTELRNMDSKVPLLVELNSNSDLRVSNTDLCMVIMSENDDQSIELDAEREKFLIRSFSFAGMQLTFED